MRRLIAQASLILSTVLGGVGCYDKVYSVYIPPAPSGLFYELEPSGDPARPRGIILRWTPVDDPNLESYRVYSRASQGNNYGLRGTTSSPSFHDDGQPHLQYYVTAVSIDGGESPSSNVILVDERLRLPAPTALSSISLNGAIHLQWPDNAYLFDPAGFNYYRVYSAAYNLDNNLCGSSWSLEGTTVSSSFLAANLPNGVPRCFGVSAVTIEGFESLWSPLRNDTPRPDARNVVVYATSAEANRSGFRFWLDANNDGVASPIELGLVGAGASTSMDFYVSKDPGGPLFLVPQRSVTSVQIYGSGPIADLTSIDLAPSGGYSRSAVQAVPQYGYVFQMTDAGTHPHYGALRVTAVGTDYVIFDWSYQTDAGNPELMIVHH